MMMRSPLFVFAAVTLTAPVLIALGAVFGGYWALAGVLWMTALTACLDELVARTLPSLPEADEFPAGDLLSVLLALSHFALWVLVVAAIGGLTGLSTIEKLLVYGGAGLFMGQVSNSNAHELIHRSDRRLRTLGRWVYISVLHGHHASAHMLVHHVHVGTKTDPNTARPGEGFYNFAWRAWRGEARAGFRAEQARLLRAGKPGWQNPYYVYATGGLGFLVLAALIGGVWGLIGALCLAGFAQTQLMMSDYVQHYGLYRRIGPNGKPEPVAARHSWNAPHIFSTALMLNAPRHSDHHANPRRPYPALELSEDMPMLPRSLPVMACVALYPRLWRKVMDPRAAKWMEPV